MENNTVTINKSTLKWLLGLAFVLLGGAGKLIWDVEFIVNAGDKRIAVIEVQYIRLNEDIAEIKNNLDFIRNHMIQSWEIK